MKKITVMVAALMLAGCASAPKPSVMSQKKKAPAIAKVAPVEQPTPSQSLKKRWGYFQIPKWLHR